MKKTILLSVSVLCLVLLASCSREETISLIPGDNLEGWHVDVPAMDNNPDTLNPFIVRNGMLVSLGTPGGHLITDDIYSDYRLVAEYRFAGEPGNCGILVHASTPRALYGMFPKSLEVQLQHEHAGDFWCIQEDIIVDNMIERRGPEEDWGVSEGKNRRIINLTDSSEYDPGEWNTMLIECIGDEIYVWVNNDLVNHGYDCTATGGQIAIQAEGSEVEFRRLDLTKLD
ncbi:MAG TPA: DUF1080 domain-containing protein [Bacteroidetes bacterium]|nr:DUF1080 domain-containing protein [Bacteroidota bacterium]